MDLYEKFQQTEINLNKSIRELRNSATKYAEAERTYKIILNQECLRLRAEGEAIGMIKLICYGIEKVANARYERDTAKAVYVANQEAINVYKLELRLLDEQIRREWGAPD